MSRLIQAALTASAAATLAFPGAALAAHGHHHKRSHARRHVAHAKQTAGSTRQSSTGSTTTTPATTPSTPTTPATPPAATPGVAGVVSSFDGTTLTITTASNQVLSGKVGPETRIFCISPTTATPDGDADDSASTPGSAGSDDSSDSTSNGTAASGAHSSSDRTASPRDHGSGDGGSSDHHGVTDCTTAALVAGTSVKEALLAATDGGVTWTGVGLLVAPPATTSPTS